jgi:hypothetical protein
MNTVRDYEVRRPMAKTIDEITEDMRKTGWNMFKLGFLSGMFMGAGLVCVALWVASMIVL